MLDRSGNYTILIESKAFCASNSKAAGLFWSSFILSLFSMKFLLISVIEPVPMIPEAKPVARTKGEKCRDYSQRSRNHKNKERSQ